MCPGPYWPRFPPPPPSPPLYALPGPPSITEGENRDRQALSHHRELERALTSILGKIPTDECRSDVKDALQVAQSHISGLEKYLGHMIPTHIYNERRPDDSTAAQRTFDVPELLEMILDYLPVPAMLNFYQVNRTIRNAIDGSPKLQTKLCLRAAPSESHLYTPFSNLIMYVPAIDDPLGFGRCAGFCCYHYFGRVVPHSPKDTTSDGERRTVTIVAYFSCRPGQRLPLVGKRYRSSTYTNSQDPHEVRDIANLLSFCVSVYLPTSNSGNDGIIRMLSDLRSFLPQSSSRTTHNLIRARIDDR